MVYDYIVVGAGLSGLVLTERLSQRDCRLCVIEKEDAVGGLARSFHYPDGSFDIGPHRFFTLKKGVMEYILKILKHDYYQINRKSSVYFFGRYYDWPLHFSNVFKLPLKILGFAFCDLFLHLIFASKGRVSTDSFADYIKANYGKTLYRLFFKGYTAKFLGISPSLVDRQWAVESIRRTIIDERIVAGGLFDIFRNMLSYKSLKTSFVYPKGGMGSFISELDRLVSDNADVFLKKNISCIKVYDEFVELYLSDGNKIKATHIFWTGSLNDLCDLLKVDFKPLRYRDLILYNVVLNRKIRTKDQWCYYGGGEIFSRISFPGNFATELESVSKSALCAEVTCNRGDSKWNEPESLKDVVVEDLIRVGVISDRAQVDNVYIERIPNAYPIYSMGYGGERDRIKDLVESCGKITLLGRTASFWYNNMDDSIEDALRLASTVRMEMNVEI